MRKYLVLLAITWLACVLVIALAASAPAGRGDRARVQTRPAPPAPRSHHPETLRVHVGARGEGFPRRVADPPTLASEHCHVLERTG